MKRIFSLLLVAMLIITAAAGCSFKDFKFTGPKWVTKVTVPLALRQVSLADMVGVNFNAYAMDPQVWTSPEVGYIYLSPGAPGSIQVTLPITGEIPVPYTESVFTLTTEGYGTAVLSNNTTYNKFDIQITGAVAGVGGLTFKFWDGLTEVASTTIPSGESSGLLSLCGQNLSATGSYKFSVEGALNCSVTGTADITITPSQFEVASFTVDAASLSSLQSFDTSSSEVGIDLPEEIDSLLLKENSELSITTDMPDKMTISAKLDIEGRDSFGATLTSATQTLTDLKKADKTVLVLGSALNTVLATKPASLYFRFYDVALGGTGNVTVNASDTIKFTITVTLGLDQITTSMLDFSLEGLPDAVKDQNLIQSVKLVINTNNTSDLGLNIIAKLYNGPDPLAPGVTKVELPLSIPANDTFNNTITLTAAQFTELIKNGTVYNQITIVNTSPTNATAVAPDDYVELKAYAQADVLAQVPAEYQIVNNQ